MPQKVRRRSSKIRENLIVLLAILAMSNLFILFTSRNPDLKIFLWGSAYSIVCGFTLYKGFVYIIAKLDEKIPWLQNPLKRLFVGLGLQVALLLVVVFIVSFAIKLVTMKEVDYLVIYQHAKFSFLIGLTFLVVATVMINGIHFFIKWKEAAVNEEKLKREALNLQFEALKNQVNPHFLFNSLSALTSMIRKDADASVRFVEQLSTVYRYLLEYRNEEIIDLATELDFLTSYIYLYRIRHGKNLEVRFNHMADKQYSVITYSLQMLVENAIKHNEISSEKKLLIEIEQSGDGYIWIKNTLQPKTTVLKGSQLGLDNISTRYRILTNKEVKIIPGPQKFQVGLPLLPALQEKKTSET